VGTNFIADGTHTDIVAPYAIAVNPSLREIYISDAKDYILPGEVSCYGYNGVRKWKYTAGVAPAAVAWR
jgi:hypothetical protein